MTDIRMVTIKLGRDLFNERQIRAILRNSAEQLAKDIKVDFGVTVQTWKNKPKFRIERAGNAFMFSRIIGTDSDIYKFVSGGTRVRYATMTPDFVAKSRVRVIGSRPGRGGVAYVSRAKPRPGIKARKFDLVIRDKWAKLAPQVVQRAIDTEVTKR